MILIWIELQKLYKNCQQFIIPLNYLLKPLRNTHRLFLLKYHLNFLMEENHTSTILKCVCDTMRCGKGDTGFLLFSGVPFPKNFQQVCKKILSRLFRVFVHVYIHHFDMICSMGAEAHINTCYKHYYFFISEFSLIDHSELEPLVRELRIHYFYRGA